MGNPFPVQGHTLGLLAPSGEREAEPLGERFGVAAERGQGPALGSKSVARGQVKPPEA